MSEFVELRIQSLLNPLATGGCFSLIAPQQVVKPYIIYQVISNVPDVELDGTVGLKQRRVQIDAYADTYAAAKTLERGIEVAMQGADFTNTPISSNDLYETEVQLYRVTMDYSVWSAN